LEANIVQRYQETKLEKSGKLKNCE